MNNKELQSNIRDLFPDMDEKEYQIFSEETSIIDHEITKILEA